MIVGVE